MNIWHIDFISKHVFFMKDFLNMYVINRHGNFAVAHNDFNDFV